jgi:hypothetical protein
MKDRVVIEGHIIQVRDEPEGLGVKDRVATNLRSAGKVR